MYGNQQPRPVGVKIPDGQIYDRSDKPALTVLGVLDLTFRGVQYVDKTGKKKNMLVLMDQNGVQYEAPNGESWLNGLRPLSEDFNKNIQNFVDLNRPVDPAEIPTEDQVDVVASAVAEEVSGEDQATAG